jgi:uncharacterized protein (TIGR02246 family)
MRLLGVVAAGVFLLSGAGLAFAAEDAQTVALQKLIDKAEIEALVAKYVTALDTLDADAYENVFTEDGVYDVTGTVYKGRAAIRKIVTDLQASRARNEAAGTASPRLYHVMANSAIEILDATNARHQSYAQTVRAADNGQFIVGFMGRYEDVLVKVDGRWLIQERKLVSFVPPAAASPATR